MSPKDRRFMVLVYRAQRNTGGHMRPHHVINNQNMATPSKRECHVILSGWQVQGWYEYSTADGGIENGLLTMEGRLVAARIVREVHIMKHDKQKEERERRFLFILGFLLVLSTAVFMFGNLWRLLH